MYLACITLPETTKQPVRIAKELRAIEAKKRKDPGRILSGLDYTSKEYWVLRLGVTFISCNRQEGFSFDLHRHYRDYIRKNGWVNERSLNNPFFVCQTMQLADPTGAMEYYEGYILADNKLHFTAWNTYQNMVIKGIASDGLSPRKDKHLCVGYYPPEWEILGVKIPTQLIKVRSDLPGIPVGEAVLSMYDTQYGCPKYALVGGI